jgi:hypothetical protein
VTAYPLSQRQAHAEQAILWAAAGGWLASTSCTHICKSYGIPQFTADLKRMKGSLFPEFLSNGEDQ